MLTKSEFLDNYSSRIILLDGATGTYLLSAGKPRGICQEKWIIHNPEIISELQRSYAAAGSDIIYAPTFQANGLALRKHGFESEIASINQQLIAISRKAAPNCLIAGNLTTLRGCIDTSDEHNIGNMTEVYGEQLRYLVKGGADIVVAETLLHPLEAKAILVAAEREGISSVMISFTARQDGALCSGHSASDVFGELEDLGAVALGLNCIAADDSLPLLIKKLKQSISVPLICKPNTGRAVNGTSPIDINKFTDIMQQCIENGAAMIGGCCGTTPAHIAALKKLIS